MRAIKTRRRRLLCLPIETKSCLTNHFVNHLMVTTAAVAAQRHMSSVIFALDSHYGRQRAQLELQWKRKRINGRRQQQRGGVNPITIIEDEHD